VQDYFRNQSLFDNLEADPPQCFLDLEQHLAPRAAAVFHPGQDPVIALAENLCRRLADAVFYAKELTESRSRMKRGGHNLISTRLVGFYASCKALLDAAAIALAHQYGLTQASGAPLTSLQQDFAKGAIWAALRTQHPDVHARYLRLKPTMDEIVDWRNASLHRVSPIVHAVLRRNVQTRKAHFHEYEMVVELEPDFTTLLANSQAFAHGPPTFHYDRWRLDLVGLCEEVCADITATT
jgi:hypothetical protein